MTRLAFVDGYPERGLGHHPDLILGLAEASVRLTGYEGPTRMYCPPAFAADRTLPDGVEHRPYVRTIGATRQRHRERMSAVHSGSGADLMINLFFDEDHVSFPVTGPGPRIVHTLHRPAELADDVVGRCPDRDPRMTKYLRHAAPNDLFVVHTRSAYVDAARWLPPERLLTLPWPAASKSEITARFDANRPARSGEPHALLIGDARDAKGIHKLLMALADGGPLLRIVGQQPLGIEAALRDRYRDTRVEWETGWISRDRLSAAIVAASVVVFPYLETFGRHGGVSGALAQALTFGKPLVVSTVLADQVVASDAVLPVAPGDVTGLRCAIEGAVRRSAELHRAAAATLKDVRDLHSYDQHLARIVARAAG